MIEKFIVEGGLGISPGKSITLGGVSLSAALGVLDVSGDSVFNGAVTLGALSGDDLNFTGSAASNLIPKADDTYNLGTSALHWDVGYFNELRGDHDEMIITADGDESSNSGSASNSLSLHASGGIFTQDTLTVPIIVMENSLRSSFSKIGTGSALEMFTFEADEYSAAKVVVSIKDSSSGYCTASELLFVCEGDGTSGVLIEYSTISTQSSVAGSWAIANVSGSSNSNPSGFVGHTMSVTCSNAAGTIVKGTYELIA